MKLAAAVRQRLPIIIGAGALVAGGVLASAGSAEAAGQLGQGDLGAASVSGHALTPQSEIQAQSVNGGDIAEDSVSGHNAAKRPELQAGSVNEEDLSKSVNTKLNQVPGYTVTNTEVRWHAGNKNESAISCAEGQVALGGGYAMSGTANGDVADVHVNADEPMYSGGVATGWHVTGSAAGEVNVKAWVICAG